MSQVKVKNPYVLCKFPFCSVPLCVRDIKVQMYFMVLLIYVGEMQDKIMYVNVCHSPYQFVAHHSFTYLGLYLYAVYELEVSFPGRSQQT